MAIVVVVVMMMISDDEDGQKGKRGCGREEMDTGISEVGN
jgi:hypothetical protein